MPVTAPPVANCRPDGWSALARLGEALLGSSSSELSAKSIFSLASFASEFLCSGTLYDARNVMSQSRASWQSSVRQLFEGRFRALIYLAYGARYAMFGFKIRACSTSENNIRNCSRLGPSRAKIFGTATTDIFVGPGFLSVISPSGECVDTLPELDCVPVRLILTELGQKSGRNFRPSFAGC